MYSIKPLKSERHKIKRTKEQEAYIMPNMGTLNVVGRTGSGKTTIIINLLKNRNMLKDVFDIIYVFTMTPATDLLEHVPDIKEENVFNDDPEKLQELINKSKNMMKNIPFEDVPNVLFILDDIVQSTKMMNSKAMKDIYYGSTHYKCNLWMLSQNYKSIPKKLRCNTHGIILCHGITNGEKEAFTEEWQSAFMDKKRFLKLVDYALENPYSFIFVNATHTNKKEAYRKGFNEILIIE